jgi:hypothetical protein
MYEGKFIFFRLRKWFGIAGATIGGKVDFFAFESYLIDKCIFLVSSCLTKGGNVCHSGNQDHD